MKAYGGVDVYIHVSWPRHYLEISGQPQAPGKEPPLPII
jgi:hypothetical protein